MTRLLKPALAGESSILIEKGMDLVPGDKIALLPTAYENVASDEAVIATYDTATGDATLTTKLNYYHWGNEKTYDKPS